MSADIPELVIRQVTENVWTFSRPFPRFGFLPWGGRSTAIKLDAGVWVLASTPLTQETKSTIDKLGPVKWIVAADILHHMFLAEFKKAYPDAKLIGVEGLGEKKKAEGVELDGGKSTNHLPYVKLTDLLSAEYGRDPAGTLYGFEDEIKACYFSGFENKDVAFHHVASKTLIVADLLFNLPGKEQYSKTTKSAKIPIIGKLDPYTWVHKNFVWGAGKDKPAMTRDAKTVAEWDFERVIMCHGDVIETDGKKAWASAYTKYLA
ncbi:hypothetical protein C8J56DRAFT_814825 [Mycena floridula]|nr:hypothetical protein C8J56DRAFT_814825 [Mycena floridula]